MVNKWENMLNFTRRHTSLLGWAGKTRGYTGETLAWLPPKDVSVPLTDTDKRHPNDTEQSTTLSNELKFSSSGFCRLRSNVS